MRKWFILDGAAVILLLSSASQAFPDTKSGEAKLQELKFQDVARKALKVSLGNKVKADCSYYINPDFLGKKVISVQARIKNTSNKLMYYGYYVAFFDKGVCANTSRTVLCQYIPNRPGAYIPSPTENRPIG